MKNHDDPKDPMISEIKRVLDDGVEKMNASTAARLRAARQKALAAQPHGFLHTCWQRFQGTSNWLKMPLAGALTAGLIVWLWLPAHVSKSTFETGQVVADMDILGGEESLELFADFDFYLWLASETPEGARPEPDRAG